MNRHLKICFTSDIHGYFSDIDYAAGQPVYLLALPLTHAGRGDRRAPGERIVSIKYRGEELPEGKPLTLCLNNYRASGAGGYPLYAACPLVKEQPTEIAQLIMDYIAERKSITVDKTQWLHVLR